MTTTLNLGYMRGRGLVCALALLALLATGCSGADSTSLTGAHAATAAGMVQDAGPRQARDVPTQIEAAADIGTTPAQDAAVAPADAGRPQNDAAATDDASDAGILVRCKVIISPSLPPRIYTCSGVPMDDEINYGVDPSGWSTVTDHLCTGARGNVGQYPPIAPDVPCPAGAPCMGRISDTDQPSGLGTCL
ncbi:MAG: hypothetical protein ACRD2H_05090 [Terriglobales bacterium]